MNPHDHATTRSLVLPVCQFQHSRSTCYNIAQVFQFGNSFFEIFLIFFIFPSLVDNTTLCYTVVSADNTGKYCVMGLFLSLQILYKNKNLILRMEKFYETAI